MQLVLTYEKLIYDSLGSSIDQQLRLLSS